MPSIREELLSMRSEEAQEVLGKPPHFLLLWGIPMLLLVFMGFVALAAFIRYPDVLQAKVLISSNPPPVRVFARSPGALHLLVQDGQQVQAGEALAYIQNPASWVSVQQLLQSLESSTGFDEAAFVVKAPAFEQGVGELQPYFEALLQACKEKLLAEEYPLYDYTQQSLSQLLQQKQKVTQNLQEKYALDYRLLAQAQKSYRIDSILYVQKVKSTLEQYQSESEYLRQQQSLKLSEQSLLGNIEQLQDLRGRIGEQQLRAQEQRQKLLLNLGQAYRNLQTQITLWQSRYLLISPLGGSVQLLSYWADNQYVSGEQAVLSVIPEANNTQSVRVYLPLQGAGKVQAGQAVWLSLYDYPEQEYGKLRGEIQKISTLSQRQNGQEEAQYILEVKLQDGNQTLLGKSITFKPEMEGEASVITAPYSLLSRIFSPLLRLAS